ncbi:MAG: FAD-dependent oxidoreductase [Candidatus Eremiobacterota bacterium]
MKEKFSSQQRIEDLKDILWDVTIIGAGPAGSSLAISLAGKNHRVLLLDKETFPRKTWFSRNNSLLNKESSVFRTKPGLHVIRIVPVDYLIMVITNFI